MSTDARAAALEQAWHAALTLWGLAVNVSAPTLKGGETDPIAYIDLRSREVVVNGVRLAEMDCWGSLTAILAHELGHHLHYPHSLTTQARLELLERELLPMRGGSLLNLFNDFMINCELVKHPEMLEQLSAVYAAMKLKKADAAADPCFVFFLVCFEEAWRTAPGALTGPAGPALEALYLGARAEAQMLAETVPNLGPNVFTQFIYFASVFSRYQPLEDNAKSKSKSKSKNPFAGDHSEPEAGDYADALQRSSQEREAVKRGVASGWLDAAKVPDDNAAARIRAATLPGLMKGQPQKLASAMALHYRRLAERYLMKPPPTLRDGEPLIPSTLTEWDSADSPKEIDWLASVSARGHALGVAMPLKRELDADDPVDQATRFSTRLEIYLDVSGSMPDPKTALNPMTLAAQVLATSALRAGGSARALIYSSNHVKHWTWTRSEITMSQFLMTYIGGGTTFPFGVLTDSMKETAASPPIRIVLTDADFHHNMKQAKAEALLREAQARSPFIILLNNARPEHDWVKAIAATSARVVCVSSIAEFPKTAAALALALFAKLPE